MAARPARNSVPRPGCREGAGLVNVEQEVPTLDGGQGGARKPKSEGEGDCRQRSAHKVILAGKPSDGPASGNVT